jgi:thiol-disulfide isomerase/thioredoxin
MTRYAYWIAGALIFAAVLYVYVRPGGTGSPAGPAALEGQPAPSFSVPALDGGASGLDAYRGRIVVMNLWASWCPPCREEMPDLQRFYRAYASKNVVVLGVDERESPDRIRSFTQSLGVRYPILIDDQQQYGRVYAAIGLPTTFIISPKGIVVRGFDGPLSYPQMVAAVEPLLRK